MHCCHAVSWLPGAPLAWSAGAQLLLLQLPRAPGLLLSTPQLRTLELALHCPLRPAVYNAMLRSAQLLPARSRMCTHATGACLGSLASSFCSEHARRNGVRGIGNFRSGLSGIHGHTQAREASKPVFQLYSTGVMSMKAHLELAQVCTRARQLLYVTACPRQESAAYMLKSGRRGILPGNLLLKFN